MNTWFRFYAEALNHAKVQRLSPDLFKAWVNILCMACNGDGNVTGNISDVAFALRVTEETAGQYVDDLVHAGLIDDLDDYIKPHNWDERQFKSDSSKERVAAFRARKSLEKTQKQENSEALNRGIKLNGDGIKPCNVTGNGSVTPQDSDSDSDTDTERNKKEPRASGAGFSRSPEFHEFWARYPNKVGKPVAERAFVKALKVAEWHEIRLGLALYVNKTDDRPWCNPATWLNQQRWNDLPADTPKARPRHGGNTVEEIANRMLAEIEGEENEQISSSQSNIYSLARLSDNR